MMKGDHGSTKLLHAITWGVFDLVWRARPFTQRKGLVSCLYMTCSSGYVIQLTCYVIYHEYHYFVVVALTTHDYFHRRVRSQECNVRC